MKTPEPHVARQIEPHVAFVQCALRLTSKNENIKNFGFWITNEFSFMYPF